MRVILSALGARGREGRPERIAGGRRMSPCGTGCVPRRARRKRLCSWFIRREGGEQFGRLGTLLRPWGVTSHAVGELMEVADDLVSGFARCTVLNLRERICIAGDQAAMRVTMHRGSAFWASKLANRCHSGLRF